MPIFESTLSRPFLIPAIARSEASMRWPSSPTVGSPSLPSIVIVSSIRYGLIAVAP